MFFIIFFGFISHILSVNIYIDSNFIGFPSNGSITNPFTFFDELSIIPMIFSNQMQRTQSNLMISNYCFIKTPISFENISNLVFKYFIFLSCFINVDFPIFKVQIQKKLKILSSSLSMEVLQLLIQQFHL